ncbi:MAG: hypothetical protein GX197_07430 [Firmicutes bacterium]|nr:hypothetical protein [Bacillota bacterium]
MYKKVVCLVLLLMLCIFSVASAIEISPMWTLINNVTNYFSIDSGGIATMIAYVHGKRDVQKIILSNFLQRYENNEWVTIKSWSSEHNGDWAGWEKRYAVVSGYTYRLVTYCNAYDGTNWEMASLISNPQTY